MKKNYTFQVRKNKGSSWVNPVRTFYSFLNPAMAYAFRRKRKFKNYEKRLVVKTGEFPVLIVSINDELLNKWNKIKLREPEKKEKFMKENAKEMLYIFEVKEERELDGGGILVKHWDNPTGAAFLSPYFAWDYILRNRESFKGLEKRLNTIDKISGETIYSTIVDESFLEQMENSRNILQAFS